MNTITVHSWSELQETLFAGIWNERLGRYRSRFAFRGLSDANHILNTTLIRLGGEYINLERNLLRNFRKYAHRSVVEKDSIWYWLAVAQHHGLPTRLLDWTYSPFVAMHFATANVNKFDKDGVIWAVNNVQVNKMLPKKLRKVLKREGANVLTVDMLSETIDSLTTLDALSDKPFVLFFEPPSMDERIINQFSLFSVMSRPSAILNDWLNTQPEIWRKIIIPAELKWEIRDKLDTANVTERVLFPGLDGLSRWLKRQYRGR